MEKLTTLLASLLTTTVQQITLPVLFVLSFSSPVYSQQWEWAKGISSGLSDPLYCSMPIAVDEDNNIFMSWDKSDTACIIKLNSAGDELWRKQIISENIHLTDASAYGNHLYVSGSFTDSLLMDSTAVLISRGASDGFLMRLDDNGNLIWISQMGGTDVDATNSVCFDSEDNIWVAGAFSDTALFSADTLFCQGSRNMFIAKYDISGNLLYIRSSSGDSSMGYSYAQKIRCGTNDNLYILGGYFEMQLDTFYLPPAGSPYNDPQFLTMMNKHGVVQWLDGFGGFTHRTTDITMDAAGSVYTTGSWNWTSDAHLWVTKYNSAGQQVWTRTMDRGYGSHFHSGGIAVSGEYLYADAHASLFYYDDGVSSGSNYLLVSKYDTAGTVLLMDTIPTQGQWHPVSMHYNTAGDYFLVNGMNYANGGPLTPSAVIGDDSISANEGNTWLAKFSDGMPTSVSSSSWNKTFSIYPNPAKTTFTVSCPSSGLGSNLNIYNTLGVKIGSRQLETGNNTIDMSSQPKGIYYVELLSGEKRSVNKIVLH